MMNAFKATFYFTIFQFVAPLFMADLAIAEKRVALVIGNQSYSHISPLQNPNKDATDIASALRRLNFDVTEHFDVSHNEMRKAVIRFGRKARQSDMAVIYFAGHGMEVGGENWLLPVDAKLKSDIDVEDEAIGLNYMKGKLLSDQTLSLVILDACRENPFASRMERTLGISRSVKRGFTRIEPEENLLVAYAARENTLADDGVKGGNSPYAAALLKHIEKPGIDIRLLFGIIRDEVKAMTNKRQVPDIYASLPGREIFLKKPEIKLTKKVEAEKKNTADDQGIPNLDRRENNVEEIIFWNSIKNATRKEYFQKYLSKYPKGIYSDLAKLNIEDFEKREKSEVEHKVDTRPKPKRLGSDQKKSDDLAKLSESKNDTSENTNIKTEENENKITIRNIQKELNRLGCKAGNADGLWGRGSRRALENYLKASNRSIAELRPSLELLNQLKTDNGKICKFNKKVVAAAKSVNNTRQKEKNRDWKCVSLTVTAPALDSKGRKWDGPLRSGPEPDIKISERRSGFAARECDDSFRCSVRFKPSGNLLDLNIVDYDDVTKSELIGSGICELKKGTCKVGRAKIAISRCG